jgi:hypothetical protein
MDEEPTKLDGTIRDAPQLACDPPKLSVRLPLSETATLIEPDWRIESAMPALASICAEGASPTEIED